MCNDVNCPSISQCFISLSITYSFRVIVRQCLKSFTFNRRQSSNFSIVINCTISSCHQCVWFSLYHTSTSCFAFRVWQTNSISFIGDNISFFCRLFYSAFIVFKWNNLAIIHFIRRQSFISFVGNHSFHSSAIKISFKYIHLSFGCSTHSIFVRYSLFLFCPETNAELISIGFTPNCSLIMSSYSFFIFTFSNKKYFGFISLTNLTNSKKSLLLGSSKFNIFHALENHWHGLHQIIMSTSEKSFHWISSTLQISIISEWFFFAIWIAYLSISLA